MKKLLKISLIMSLFVTGNNVLADENSPKRIVQVEEVTTLDGQPIKKADDLSEKDLQFDKDVEELTQELKAMTPEELNSFMNQVLVDPSESSESTEPVEYSENETMRYPGISDEVQQDMD